jgi:Fe-S-cluster formation regulator IscX/YfhJ
MSEATRPLPDFDDEDAAELAALTAAVAEADADPRVVPHAEVRSWLLELAAGNFDAPPPVARRL